MREDLTTQELNDIIEFLDGYMIYVENCSVCDKIREKIKKMLEKNEQRT